jgi:hypothetical protein
MPCLGVTPFETSCTHGPRKANEQETDDARLSLVYQT